ncbi:hypothetical protein BJ165DRAFT_1493276 [Panaeolus papilionaceus]|nr:hypothetical protein BJ165DRAFT_1493115 [Panaeolus papilionaceus]KAF9040919.1 hypothetical protein BJ165DRAFT_1493195 [Panaeolus papilionaceus]KAF9040926.1 hypothetical protein BJ165DRAFT_1493276 [Panaeolus papilionaceus]
MGYSIWDIYRAQWVWQILFTPENIPRTVRSMLLNYQKSDGSPCGQTSSRLRAIVGTKARKHALGRALRVRNLMNLLV